jgi:hypothetical protein
MPRVEGLADVTRCDPEVVLIEHLPSEIPADEHNADQLVARTGWALKDAEQQAQAIPAHDGGSAPAAPARCWCHHAIGEGSYMDRLRRKQKPAERSGAPRREAARTQTGMTPTGAKGCARRGPMTLLGGPSICG